MKIKKVSSILLVIALTVVCSMGTCFAGTLPENSENSVPVYLTVSGEMSIDFTISEKINMTGNSDTAEVTVSDLSLTNNGTMGQIEVKKLEVVTEAGWGVEDSGADFPNMAADSKKISLTSDGHDFADGAKTFADDEVLVAVSDTETIAFEGKTSPTTGTINNTKVASVIATIGIN